MFRSASMSHDIIHVDLKIKNVFNVESNVTWIIGIKCRALNVYKYFSPSDS